MREMENSGIPWIGEIPKEWVICKVKNVVSYIGSGTTPTSGKIEFYENGTVNWIQSGDLYETNKINETNKKVTESAIKLFPALHIYKANFIVIAMYGASVGNIAISNIDACVNQACCCIKTNEFNNLKYMFYWLFSCKNDFLKITDGGGQPNISQTKIKNQYYLKPSIEEQRQIADYLDSKCARIDSIKKNVESEIEALEQYKRSVITEAVTKGLDKNVEMKDSGISWIGKIPKEWKITRLKYLGNYRNGLTYSPINICSENDGILVLRSSNVQNGKIDLKDNVYVNIPIRSDMMVRYGDILICSRNGSKTLIGKNAIIDSNINASFGAFMMIYRCIDSRYLYYILNSSVFSYYIGSFFTSTINQLTGTNFGNMKIPFCPEQDERLKIITYLDSKCAKIDSIIQKKQDLLANLDTYKKSLIYEYVTGKKEVPAV